MTPLYRYVIVYDVFNIFIPSITCLVLFEKRLLPACCDRDPFKNHYYFIIILLILVLKQNVY